MRIPRWLLGVGLAALALPSLRGAAAADAVTYASTRQIVRAGIIASSALNIGSTGSENPDPHVFYVLESRADLKPSGLEFVNPLAPAAITGDVYARWKRRDRTGNDPAFIAGSALADVFRVGARVTKDMGAYWEVNVDTVASQDLQQFDVLFLHSHKPNIAFPAEVREKLRRYVDSGGTLWIEQCGNMTFANGSPFMLDVQFNAAASGGGPGTPGGVIAAPNHPLLNQPYALSANEVQSLGDKNIRFWYLYYPFDANLNPTNAPGVDDLNPPASHTLVPVVWNSRGYAPIDDVRPNPGWRPYVLAGQVGAGRVVYTAQDTGCAINDYVGGVNVGFGGNSGAISGSYVLGSKASDVKFAYNLSVWATAHRTVGSDARRVGSSPARTAAVLEEKWTAPVNGALDRQVGGAVFFKGCVYAVGGDLVLRCYTARPGSDLDGDGNPDQGIADFVAGASYDLIWQVDLNRYGSGNAKGASAPTVIEFYDPAFTGTTNGLVNQQQRELVVVTLADGTVVACRALPRAVDASGRLVLAGVQNAENVDWVVPSSQTGAVDFGAPTVDLAAAERFYWPIPAPAWSEGALFVALNTNKGGVVAAIDPRRGSSLFRLQKPVGVGESMVPDQAAFPLTAIWGSPAAGYVRDTATGAVDKVIYVATSPGGGRAAQVLGIPFMTRGEPLTVVSSATSVFRSRARVPWFVPNTASADGDNLMLRPRVYCSYRDAATTAYGSKELTYTTAASPGANEFTAKFDMGEARVIIGSSVNVPFERADGSTGSVGVSQPYDERFTFYADYVYNWSPLAADPPVKVNARSAFIAPDPTSTNFTFSQGVTLTPDDLILFQSYTSAGMPGRSTLFAANEQGSAQSRLKWTYVLNQQFQMRVNGELMTIMPRFVDATGRYPLDAIFVGQPAYNDDTVYAVARVGGAQFRTSVLCAFRAKPDFVLHLGRPIDQGVRIRIRQPNPYTTTADPDAFIELAATQYTVDYAAQTIRISAMAPPGAVSTNYVSASLPFVVQVGTAAEQVIWGSRIDPSGARRGGSDGVDNLLWYTFLPGIASTSPMVQGDVVWIGLTDGRLVSYDADPATTNPAFQANGDRVDVSPRWVVTTGASGLANPPTMVDNVMAVATAGGIVAYEDNITVVADSQRILEVNAAGDAVWSCDGTRAYSVAGGSLTDYTDPLNPIVGSGVPAAQMVPFAKPAVVRRMGSNGFLVVDTGNNRVVHMDRGGSVLWEVNRLFDDYRGLLRPGDPLTLNQPTDCSYWTEFESNLSISGGGFSYSGAGYITHYLIADTGNFRVIELIDVHRLDGTVVMLRRVNFVSSTLASQGKRYKYRSVQRVVLRNSDLPADPPSWRQNPYDPNLAPLAMRYLTLAAVQNARMVDPSTPQFASQGLVDTSESGGGSLAVLKESGDPLAVISNLRIPNGSGGVVVQPISGPVYLSMFTEAAAGGMAVRFLIVDSNGCYQARLSFVQHAGAPAYTEPVMDVEWLLTADDYYRMTGKQLQAASLVRLTASANNPQFPALRQFLIANRFSGSDDPAVFNGGTPFFNSNVGNPAAGNITGPSDFHGEVFVVNPSTFSFGGTHGYIPDYSVVAGSFLWPNDGQPYLVQGAAVNMPRASIIRRIPAETVPRPPDSVIRNADGSVLNVGSAAVGTLIRSVGSNDRGSNTATLEQPGFADRPN